MSVSRWLAVGFVFASIAIVAMLRAAPDNETSNHKAEAQANRPKPTASESEQAPTAENDEAFRAELLRIAKEYKAYGRVDDETRWAPYLCRMPMPSLARFSNSNDGDGHGEKLYFLFAKDREAYMGMALPKAEVGQVLVKESWHPRETTRELSTKHENGAEQDPLQGDRGLDGILGGGSYYLYATKGEKFYHAEKLAGLYIMYQTDVATPGTDEGWVYGTVTADGKAVTSVGRVASCMACHQEAPHGRLFGLPLQSVALP